jgi:hypothetical protein
MSTNRALKSATILVAVGALIIVTTLVTGHYIQNKSTAIQYPNQNPGHGLYVHKTTDLKPEYRNEHKFRMIQFFVEMDKLHPDDTSRLLKELSITLSHDGKVVGFDENIQSKSAKK